MIQEGLFYQNTKTMKAIAIKTFAVLALLLAGAQAQAQDIDESKLVGTYELNKTMAQEDPDMGMTITIALKATLTLNADHSVAREGVMEMQMPIDEEGISNTFILKFNFKSIGETWAVEDGNLLNDIQDIDMKFMDATAEKNDMIAAMMLGELKKQGPAMAEGLKQSLKGKSVEKIVSVDEKGIATVDNSDNDFFYTRK